MTPEEIEELRRDLHARRISTQEIAHIIPAILLADSLEKIATRMSSLVTALTEASSVMDTLKNVADKEPG